MDYIFIALMGLYWGSFINVCIFRIPRNMSGITKSSSCFDYWYQLSSFNILPILTFIKLKGRCHYCKKAISIQYLFVELFFALFALFFFDTQPLTIHSFLIWLIFSILFTIAVIDFNTMFIYNNSLYILIFLSLIVAYLNKTPLYDILLNAGLFSIPLYLISITTNTIGKGDAYFMFAVGLLLNFNQNIVAFFITSIISGVYASFMLLLNKKTRKDILPFIPFLFLGILISYFFSDPLVQFYNSLFVVFV